MVLPGCGHARVATPADVGVFSYDASRPLHFADRGRVNHGYPIAVHEVSFAGRKGERVRGFLVLPPRGRHLPAVVYLHGSGGDASELLVPATWIAARGAIALTITAPSRTVLPPRNASALATLRWQRDLEVRDVVAVRRAVDLLRSLPRVDPQRIGFVGWSAGARAGAILAGVEPHVSAFVLMSGGSLSVSNYVVRAPEQLRADVKRLLGQVDPLRFVAAARPATLLLEDGRQDYVVPKTALDALAHAAPDGATIRWYDAGHSLNEAAYRDQLDWLERKLAINGPVTSGARTGP